MVPSMAVAAAAVRLITIHLVLVAAARLATFT
jgi:hypothetical protein